MTIGVSIPTTRPRNSDIRATYASCRARAIFVERICEACAVATPAKQVSVRCGVSIHHQFLETVDHSGFANDGGGDIAAPAAGLPKEFSDANASRNSGRSL